MIDIGNDETTKDELVGNVYGEFEPIEGLRFRSSLGLNLAYLTYDGFRPLFFLNGAQLNTEKTSVNKTIERYFTWQWNNTVAYDKKVDNHSFGILLGTEAQEFSFEDLSGFNAGVPTNDPNNVYLNLATDTVWTANGGARESALFSIFGRLNYSFKDKYSLTKENVGELTTSSTPNCLTISLINVVLPTPISP